MSSTNACAKLLPSVAESSCFWMEKEMIFLPGIFSLYTQLGFTQPIRAVTVLTEKQQSFSSMALHLN